MLPYANRYVDASVHQCNTIVLHNALLQPQMKINSIFAHADFLPGNAKHMLRWSRKKRPGATYVWDYAVGVEARGIPQRRAHSAKDCCEAYRRGI